MKQDLTDVERTKLEDELERLRQEHRDLDGIIDALETLNANDFLQLQRLKKKRHTLRERITELEDHLFPDIIA